MKSICQTAHGPSVNLKCYRAVWTGFQGLYLGKAGQARQALLAALLMFSHQYWFTNVIILSVDQWLHSGTAVSSGNFGIWCRAGWLFGPNQSYVFFIGPIIT